MRNLPRANQPQAAEALNVSPRSVQTAKQISVRAVPQVTHAVKNGQLSLNGAAAIARLPASQQMQVLKKGPRPAAPSP